MYCFMLSRNMQSSSLLRSQSLRLYAFTTSCIPRSPRIYKCRKWSVVRHNSTARPSTTTVNGKKPLFPERLLIYHAGTTRTVFLGCLKVTTIFIFTFFSLVVAPTHFFAEDQSKWISIAVLISGTVPLVAVSYLTSPFVNYIHLRLPIFARHSKELLMRYSKSLPPTTEVDVTTMNFIGKPKVTRMKITELQSKRERFGMVNFVRKGVATPAKVAEKRPWYLGKPPKIFGVHGGKTRILGGEIWENVRKGIEKRNS